MKSSLQRQICQLCRHGAKSLIPTPSSAPSAFLRRLAEEISAPNNSKWRTRLLEGRPACKESLTSVDPATHTQSYPRLKEFLQAASEAQRALWFEPSNMNMEVRLYSSCQAELAAADREEETVRNSTLKTIRHGTAHTSWHIMASLATGSVHNALFLCGTLPWEAFGTLQELDLMLLVCPLRCLRAIASKSITSKEFTFSVNTVLHKNYRYCSVSRSSSFSWSQSMSSWVAQCAGRGLVFRMLLLKAAEAVVGEVDVALPAHIFQAAAARQKKAYVICPEKLMKTQTSAECTQASPFSVLAEISLQAPTVSKFHYTSLAVLARFLTDLLEQLMFEMYLAPVFYLDAERGY
eukprot:4472550-Amphidinium_carterae.5